MHAESSAAAAARATTTRRYRPYYTPAEVAALTYRQRGKLSASREERNRQTACDFVEGTGQQLGFPRRVIATAQLLYHRFHLFFPLKDFQYQEVCLSALYVSSKLHDTLKKPRDILLASYALRYPELARGQGGISAASVDAQKLENERRRVLSIERLILETICFNFKVGDRSAFRFVVKICKDLKVPKQFCRLAWLVTADAHRTLAPLQYPVQSLCLAGTYALSLLVLGPRAAAQAQPDPAADDAPARAELDATAGRIHDLLSQTGQWESRYSSTAAEVVEIVHSLLDLYVVAATAPAVDLQGSSHPSPLSPAERNSDALNTVSRPGRAQVRPAQTDFKPGSGWTAQTLTQLKIRLREASRQDGAPTSMPGGDDGQDAVILSNLLDVGEGMEQRGRQIATGRNVGEVWGAVMAGLGSNDGTIRFLSS